MIRHAIAALVVLLIGLAPAPSLPASSAEYRAYARAVRAETERNYRRHRDVIDPRRQRGRAGSKDLDHVIAVKVCWLRRMTVDECAAPANLRVIDASENRALGCKQQGCRLQQQPAAPGNPKAD
ncbi:MAG: hypothetical protein J0H82_18605 [Alphaproteobacteria bacterium]|nr:hypothetical protein [Alphaproteobacteria bacterium]